MEIGTRFIAAVLILLGWILSPIFWFRRRAKPQQVPPDKNPLLHLSAVKLAKQIRNQKLTSTALVKVYIKRIKAVNPIINAVVEDRFAAALEEARVVDTFLKENSYDPLWLATEKPLLGVPLTVKESCGLAGLSFAVGSLSREGVKATEDGEAVAKLKAAGAIPLLVSNTPELCLSWETDNFITGTTNNPYNTHYSSGGSSGGEVTSDQNLNEGIRKLLFFKGALLGAGASLLAVASDVAGSIRLPAAFNGIFGHKPTPGIISIRGHYPSSTDENFEKYLVIGPLTRYAKDLKLMMNILTKGTQVDLRLNEQVDLSKLNVYFMESAGFSLVLQSVQPAIKGAIRKSVDHLKRNCKSKISDIKFNIMEETCEMSAALFFALKDVPNVLENPKNPKTSSHLYTEIVKSIFGLSKFSLNTLLFYVMLQINMLIPKRNYDYYKALCIGIRAVLKEYLADSGVFLYPTFPLAGFQHNQCQVNISGVTYAMAFNILGFPCTNVPVGFDKRGLPVGIQVVAAPNQDRLCLAVAKELENAFGGWKPSSQ